VKTKLLCCIFIVSFATIILSFAFTEENYLPTVIHINTPGKFDKELLLNLRAALATRKVKTISKEEALELQREEHERVMKPYYENLKKTDKALNFDETKVYMSLNLRKVCNSMTIDINVTDDGIIKDTIKWVSRTLPFDFLDTKKRSWHVLVLDPKQKISILNITQTIADSIIASNVLVKQ
jgi:hypothetical protein